MQNYILFFFNFFLQKVPVLEGFLSNFTVRVPPPGAKSESPPWGKTPNPPPCRLIFYPPPAAHHRAHVCQ